MINPGIQAMLATFGYAMVPTAKKPIVGLFATGTELLDVNEPLVPGKIRNSNSHMIAAQIERTGGSVRYFGKLHDDFDTCFEAVKNALESVDLLVTTGGVSVGDYDYLPEIYEKLGAEVLFNKVAMRPGSVTTVAHFNGKLLFRRSREILRHVTSDLNCSPALLSGACSFQSSRIFERKRLFLKCLSRRPIHSLGSYAVRSQHRKENWSLHLVVWISQIL